MIRRRNSFSCPSLPMVCTAQRIRKKQDSPEKCTGKTLRQAEAYKPRPSQESEKTVSADPPIKLVPPAPVDGINDTSPETTALEEPKRPCKVALLEPEVQQRRLAATTLDSRGRRGKTENDSRRHGRCVSSSTRRIPAFNGRMARSPKMTGTT